MKIKAVFLDRDGTINIEKHFVHTAEEFELIPGSLEALRLLTDHRIDIYIVTNQSGIARGSYTEEEFLDFSRHMVDDFERQGVRITKVAYCPHLPEGTVEKYARVCNCRKPGSALLEEIISERAYKPEETVLVGDKNSDIESGLRLGIVTYLVLTGYGRDHAPVTRATYVKEDLLTAVRHILGID